MRPCTEVGLSQGTEGCLHLPESHQLQTPLFPADPISRASRTNQLTPKKWYGEEAGVELGGPRYRTLALWFSFHGLVPPVFLNYKVSLLTSGVTGSHHMSNVWTLNKADGRKQRSEALFSEQ